MSVPPREHMSLSNPHAEVGTSDGCQSDCDVYRPNLSMIFQ